jgi:hypothetical protein
MTDASAVGAAGGVGNYKGVMLCNRPFGGSAAQQKNATKPTTFSCGTVPDAVGVGQPASSRKKVKRPKKETVLTKHRRWLAELQKTKDKLEAQFVDDMMKKEEKKANFQAQEKLMRNMSHELLKGEVNEEGDYSGVEEKKEPEAKSSTASASKKGNSKSNKPAWAQVKEGAPATDEDLDLMMMDEDDEGLLDFASNLDFNAVIQDIEVKSLMKKLQEKIKNLEKDVKNEEDRDLELELGKHERELLQRIRDADMEADSKSEYEEENIDELAKLVLDENSELGAVQSKASVTSMLQQAKDKIASIQEEKKGGDVKSGQTEVSGGPTVVVHEPSEGTRVEGKNTASNLPYIRRNPAAA